MKLRVMLLIVFFAIVMTALVACLAFKYVSYNTINSIPTPVLERYKSYEHPYYLDLAKCLHESQTVYLVIASDGDVTERYQYDQAGILLGQDYHGDDMRSGGHLPIYFEKSDCKVVSTIKKNQ